MLKRTRDAVVAVAVVAGVVTGAVGWVPAAGAGTGAVTVGTTNRQGWDIRPDGTVPYAFVTGPGSVGSGSLQFGPISGTPANNKFVMTAPYSGLVSDLASISYDIYAAPNSLKGTEHLYANVYVDQASNGIGTYSRGFYDCRYDSVAPGTLAKGVWHTRSFTATSPWTTFTNTAAAPCPNTLQGLAAGSRVTAFVLNGGQSTSADAGLAGGFDNVVITTSAGATTYDFEPNTAPVLTVGGVAQGAAYELGTVPVASCGVTDTEDGTFSVPSTLSPVAGPKAAFGIGAQTATCTYTDQGGLSGTASASYTLVDTVGPTLAGAATTSPNGAGWYRDPVSIHWSAGDDGTGIDEATRPDDTVLTSEGSAVVASATVADNAGNVTAAVSPPVAIDLTEPLVTYTGATTYTVDQVVAVACAASDGLSGVASTTCAPIAGPASGFALGDSTRSATAVDVAGNTGSGSVTIRVTVTFTTLCNLTKQYVGASLDPHRPNDKLRVGLIDLSLCVKLQVAEAAAARGLANVKAATLEAYRKEVRAQTGKALTAGQGATLLALAGAL